MDAPSATRPVLSTLYAGAIVVAALYFGHELFVPLVLASLLAFLLAPACARLQNLGLPKVAAVMVVGDGDALVTPCGGCRQRIREFASPETPIHIAGPEGPRRSFTLAELLPVSFGPDHLGIAGA